MRFEADALHHQHAVTEQALNPLLVQLLEEVAAVGGHGVHAQPSRRPATKHWVRQWFSTTGLGTKRPHNPQTGRSALP